jgi:hypothetical protein
VNLNQRMCLHPGNFGMRGIRTFAVPQLVAFLLLDASCAYGSTVLSANNMHHTSVLLRSSMECSKSSAGLTNDEIRSFGSLISDISEEDCDVPKTELSQIQAKPMKEGKPVVEMNTFTGPKVNFYWKPKAGKEGAKRVTVCGSWSGWQDHYNLSLNMDTGLYEVQLEDIPNGEHQFKVSFLFFVVMI